MRNPPILSLTSYMVTAVFVVHLFLAPILYSIILDVYKKSSSEIFITQSQNIAGILADDLSSRHYLYQRDSIIGILDSAVLGGNILFIDIINSQNKIISPTDQLSINANQFIEDTYLNNNYDNIYFISVPVFLEGAASVSYKLRLGFDEATVNEELRSIQQRIISIIMVYILAMVSVFTLITRFIHKPLKLLQQKSKTIAQGEVDFPLQVPSYISDIKDLSQDLEQMRLTLIEMANHMQIQATHDELTGLPNRYLYTDRMHQAVSLAHRSNQTFAVLLLDLDRFKEINDTLGHGLGDRVLSILSKRMLDGMRESDTIARIGGDEFSIILNNVDQADAERIARKTIELIEPIIEVSGHTLKASASIGIAVYPQHGDNPELLLQHADVAMYSAKHNNKNIASYNSDMDSNNYENLMLVNDFKTSIAQNHFVSLFQPKLELDSGQICGCELLLRWRHPYLGLIQPNKFIPLAEQENLCGELTRWATSHYLSKFTDIIKQRPDFHVAINVSPVNLMDTKLLTILLKIIEANEFPAQNLTIEVTESVIMKNPERSADILNKFSYHGISISIDDFGTGYSSLAYLQKFPITELKIDKTFITDLTKESTNYPIVKASITMAHDLGINVVAEGIESAEVHELLYELGCDRVQGYHYGKPMNFKQLTLWMEDRGEL